MPTTCSIIAERPNAASKSNVLAMKKRHKKQFSAFFPFFLFLSIFLLKKHRQSSYLQARNRTTNLAMLGQRISKPVKITQNGFLGG